MTEFKDTDFRLETWPPEKRGGYRTSVARPILDAGIKVIHIPTGEAEVCTELRSQLANMCLAKERLIQRLKVKDE